MSAKHKAFVADTGRIRSEAAQLVATNPRVALLLAARGVPARSGASVARSATQQALVGSEALLGYFQCGVSYGAVEWIDDHRFAAARNGAVDVFRDDGKIERSITTSAEAMLLRRRGAVIGSRSLIDRASRSSTSSAPRRSRFGSHRPLSCRRLRSRATLG